MARMIRKFPTMVTMYMTKNRAKSGFWFSGWEESPRRVNSETLQVWLALSMVLHMQMNIEIS